MGASFKRSASIAMAVILVLGAVLMGCTGNSGTTPSTSKPTEGTTPTEGTAPTETGGEGGSEVEPITISIFNSTPGQQVAGNNKIYARMKDELGVTLKEEYLVGDLEQKLGVMIAGGEYPDMITADTKLVAAQAVIPLEDLIEQHAPNLKKHYEPYWNMLRDPGDGHIYWLPNYGVYTGDVNDSWYSGPAFWIQKAVLKEFDYPVLKTPEEYFALIEKYKEKYPEIDGQPTIGYTALVFDWRTFGFYNPPEHLAGYPNDGDVIVDDGVAQIFAHTDISKRYYKYLNDLNAKKLLDGEAFTQNYDQYLAKLASGRVLGMFDQHWNFGSAEDSLVAQGMDERTYVGIPLVYDESITDWYRDRPPVNLNNGYGISVDAKDPVRIIKFLDKLMEEEWQKFFSWGSEGEDYLVDESGQFYRSQEMRDEQTDPAWKLVNRADIFFGALPKIQGTYSDGNGTSAGAQPREFFDGLKDMDREVLSAYGHQMWTDFFSNPPENPVYYPAWQIDLIEGSDASVASTKLGDLKLKHLPAAVLSSPGDFDKKWEEFVEAVNKINIQALEDRFNEQIQWRIENWGN